MTAKWWEPQPGGSDNVFNELDNARMAAYEQGDLDAADKVEHLLDAIQQPGTSDQ